MTKERVEPGICRVNGTYGQHYHVQVKVDGKVMFGNCRTLVKARKARREFKHMQKHYLHPTGE